MYQALVPFLFQVSVWSGESYAMALHPRGARGVLLKSNEPNSYVYADIFPFSLDGQRRLRVIMAC